MLKRATLRKNSLINKEPQSERSSPCCIVSEYLFFSEMWFLTVDPFMRVSVFVAKWRILEDFHSQEYIQFFDVHCSLLLRLHFSIGCFDYRWTSRRRQSIHFRRTQVLFADHVHRRSGVHNKFSFLRFKS